MPTQIKSKWLEHPLEIHLVFSTLHFLMRHVQLRGDWERTGERPVERPGERPVERPGAGSYTQLTLPTNREL